MKGATGLQLSILWTNLSISRENQPNYETIVYKKTITYSILWHQFRISQIYEEIIFMNLLTLASWTKASLGEEENSCKQHGGRTQVKASVGVGQTSSKDVSTEQSNGLDKVMMYEFWVFNLLSASEVVTPWPRWMHWSTTTIECLSTSKKQHIPYCHFLWHFKIHKYFESI